MRQAPRDVRWNTPRKNFRFNLHVVDTTL
jgi:hypothetical protein